MHAWTCRRLSGNECGKIASLGKLRYQSVSNGSRNGAVIVSTVRRLSMICTVMSLNVRWATQRKSGEVSDSSESGQTEGGLIRVDWSSDSSIVEVPEGAQEQWSHMVPKEREWRGPAAR